MRRRSVHTVFGAVALLCAAMAGWQGLRWHHAEQVNQAIVAADQRLPDADVDIAPQARLAHALALARAGEHDAALKAFNTLIPRGELDAVGRDALFDLGNLYLRQGLPSAGAAAALPMLELAKQRYRDLLRLDPGDLDARYNLERALRLAPEAQETFAEPSNVPVERRQVQLRGMGAPELP